MEWQISIANYHQDESRRLDASDVAFLGTRLARADKEKIRKISGPWGFQGSIELLLTHIILRL